MSLPGDAEILVAGRSALLDALEALADQHAALVLIGAQAIYLHTGAVPVALAEMTKDIDLALDPRELQDDPLLEEAMGRAGFYRNLADPQPGSWLSPTGFPIDLMVPVLLAGAGGRRGGRIPPHNRHATRHARGLEAAVVDHAPKTITSLDPTDSRSFQVEVASPAALLVAKLHKLGERRVTPGRLLDKDAHDIYRLLRAMETAPLATALAKLGGNELAGSVTDEAIVYLKQLFADGPEALGSVMAGRAEELFGNSAVVSASVATLATDLLAALPSH